MSYLMKAWLVGLLLVWRTLAQADVVALDPLIQGLPLGAHLHYQVDPGGRADLAQMQARPGWRPVREEVPNVGLSRAVYWFRLELQVADTTRPWLLEVGYNLLDQVEVFSLDDSGQPPERVQTGMAAVDAPLSHRTFIIPLTLRQPGLLTLYLRVQSDHGVQLPLRLWQHQDFIVADETANLALGLFFGVLLVLLVYHFFLYAVLRDRLYLVFSFYVMAMTLFHVQLRGIGLRFFWPGEVHWNGVAWLDSGLLATFLAGLLVDWFLDLEQRGYPALRVLRLVRGLSLLSLFMAPWLDETLGVMTLVAVSSSMSALGLGAVLYHYAAGDRTLQLFGLAWLVLLAGVLVLAGNKLGLLPFNFFTDHAISLATLVFLLLLSLSLSQRAHYLNAQILQRGRQRLALLDSELEQQSQQVRVSEMQRNAAEITLRLHTESNERLLREIAGVQEEKARVLEQLQAAARLDPVTRRFNRRHFLERVQEEYERHLRAPQIVGLLLLGVDGMADLTARLGLRVADEVLARVAAQMEEVGRPHGASVFHYEYDLFAMLLPSLHLHRAEGVAELIRSTLEQTPLAVPGLAVPVRVSLGLSTLTPDTVGRAEDWVQRAVQALETARQQGGNRVCSGDTDQAVGHG